MVQRIVNAEAKASLKSSTMVQNSDIYCSRGHRSSNSIASKVQNQETTGKESKPEESKPKESKSAQSRNPAPPQFEFTEPGKTSCIDKKKEYFKKKRDQKNNIPATGNNANVVEVGEKKRNNWGNGKCYNCQKKGHFSKNCLKLSKNYCWSLQSLYQWLIIVVERLYLKKYPVSITRFNFRKTRGR